MSDLGDAMTVSTVQVGDNFLAGVYSQYADPVSAIFREFLQNAVDSGSVTLVVTVVSEADSVRVTVRNDGRPMGIGEITGRLLVLGGTGKGFHGSQDTVGGFGRAKEILYLTHPFWSIRTGGLLVQGSGVSYTISDGLPEVSGVESSILLRQNGNMTVEGVSEAFRRVVGKSVWDGTAILNGSKIPFSVPCRSPKDWPGSEWAEAHASGPGCFPNRVVIRSRGIWMFDHWTTYPGGVVIDVRDGLGKFASSRDRLVDPFGVVMQQFLSDLVTMHTRAFVRAQPSYDYWNGRLFGEAVKPTESTGSATSEDAAASLDQPAGSSVVKLAVKIEAKLAAAYAVRVGNTLPTTAEAEVGEVAFREEGEAPTVLEPAKRISSGVRFGIRRILRKYSPPSHCVPDDQGNLSSYASWVLAAYAAALSVLHREDRNPKPFSVGFVFDDSADQREAGTFVARDGGLVEFYIAPAMLRKAASGGERWKNVFQKTRQGFWDLISIACHEYAHRKAEYHTEEYAAELTRVLALAGRNAATIERVVRRA
jgi:hypothetical protein